MVFERVALRFLAGILLLCFPNGLDADILHLRDGSRHHGHLVLQDEHGVLFRVVRAGGGASVVRAYPADVVERIEIVQDDAPAEKSESPAHFTDESATIIQIVREGLELLDDDKPLAALRALQRAAHRAEPDILPRLDRVCRAARGVDLAELLARTRVCAAAEARDGRAFRIRYATTLERPALQRMLGAYQRALLRQSFGGRTLESWLAAPDEYTRLQNDAQSMVANASRAAAVVRARLQFDPALDDDRTERRALIALRQDLVRFGGRVRALTGFTSAGRSGAADPDSARPLEVLSPCGLDPIQSDSTSELGEPR